MKLTFLGTGTSTGIPQLGCSCSVCQSIDTRDKRFRTSALLEIGATRILLDCGPDFRSQMLALNHFGKIDGVLLTHEHYDHVGGLDDLRPFCRFGTIPVFADTFCGINLKKRYPYCFVEDKYPGVPKIELKILKPHQTFEIGKTKILPFVVMHGALPIFGYRIGDFCYITDMKSIAIEELDFLKGIKTLVVNGLRAKVHATHQTIDEAVQFARSLGVESTYLVHVSHDAGLHRDVSKQLPSNVYLAYDGLTIDLE